MKLKKKMKLNTSFQNLQEKKKKNKFQYIKINSSLFD